jgi:hypothetical protein
MNCLLLDIESGQESINTYKLSNYLCPNDFKRRLDLISGWFQEFNEDQRTITVTHLAVS